MSKKHWLFVVAVALQVLIVLGVPAQRVRALLSGTTVFLKTAPVDPYDILSGYHVVLSYEISDESRLPGKPQFRAGDTVYVVLERSNDGFWYASGAYSEWPRVVPEGAAVIKGTRAGRRRRIEYGIENYFIPEGMGPEIENRLREDPDQTRVEVKVHSSGSAALVRLHVGDKTYDY